MTTQKKRAPAGRKPRAAAEKDTTRPEPDSSQTAPAVIAFLKGLDYPLKPQIEDPGAIPGISPEIREEIKWNAPSFRTTDHFATFNLRTQDRVRLILHTGAKVKDTATQGMKLADPAAWWSGSPRTAVW